MIQSRQLGQQFGRGFVVGADRVRPFDRLSSGLELVLVQVTPAVFLGLDHAGRVGEQVYVLWLVLGIEPHPGLEQGINQEIWKGQTINWQKRRTLSFYDRFYRNYLIYQDGGWLNDRWCSRIFAETHVGIYEL